jgi:hypothetical protein
MNKHRWARRGFASAAIALAAMSGCSKDTSHDSPRVLASATTVTTTFEHNVTTSTAPPLGIGQRDRLHPSAQLTPGASVPTVTASQVCAAGYSSTVRDVDAALRRQVFEEYGLDKNTDGYTVDHLVPLELGGSNDLTNLWPQPSAGNEDSHSKDVLENGLHDLVCNGSMDLAAAQQAIVVWDTVDIAALRAAATTTAPPPPPTEPPTTAPPATEPPATLPPAPEPPATEPPLPAPPATEPEVPGGGATALCNDGTYSFAAHHQGACSHHGGVAEFYK